MAEPQIVQYGPDDQPNVEEFFRDSKEVVGTVAVRRLSSGLAEIKRLNLASQYRGRGLGERLLHHAMTHALDAGFTAVRLDTIRNTGPAVRLFEKAGFREIARYSDNEHADLFMELVLRKP